jgi:hypothetical protein
LAETVISPNGPNAVQAGTLIDDRGDRFAVLRFQEPGGDPVIVTFPIATFHDLVRRMNETDRQTKDEAYWRDHKR